MKSNNITVRRSNERGIADIGWLKSKHSFSFSEYYDPEHMGFRSLRVINQDQVAPKGGFPTHPHRDMEIFSYVQEGTLQHEDSMGNGRKLVPGQIQLMSAGSGITHSEFNPSDTEPLHFLQIWIKPREAGLTPSYTEWTVDSTDQKENKTLIISEDGILGSATIQQDARVYLLRLQAGETVQHNLAEGRGAWLQVVKGPATLNKTNLQSGDAGSTEVAGTLEIQAKEAPIEALLFDLK